MESEPHARVDAPAQKQQGLSRQYLLDTARRGLLNALWAAVCLRSPRRRGHRSCALLPAGRGWSDAATMDTLVAAAGWIWLHGCRLLYTLFCTLCCLQG